MPDKYFSLFKKSVSFVPISDISKFITEFVCDVQYKVDIVPMQKNIEQYRLLETESLRIQDKISLLKDIHEAYENYHNISTDMASFNYVHARANLEYAKRQLGDYEAKVEEHRQRLDYLARQVALIDDQIRELNAEKQDYFAKKTSSSGFSLSNELSQKKANFERQIAALKVSQQNILRELKNYADSLSRQAVDFYRRLRTSTSIDLELMIEIRMNCQNSVNFQMKSMMNSVL